MEGLRQIDELNAIRDRLPDLGARLAVVQPLRPALKDLPPLELEVFQLVFNHQQLAAAGLNRSLATDLDTAKAVLNLVKDGYIKPE